MYIVNQQSHMCNHHSSLSEMHDLISSGGRLNPSAGTIAAVGENKMMPNDTVLERWQNRTIFGYF
jgi:hypothetical protein